MDEAFMSGVSERIEAATEAVSSFSHIADPGKLPAVETMDEWMALHSPGAKHRCVDCKAPLVEGLASICVACGRPLPPRLAIRREEFSFDKSLAKKLFYESVHLEDPQDTSTDTTELQQQDARSSGRDTIANGYSQQQSPSTTGFGIETVERNLHGGERGQAVFSDAGGNIIPAPPESSSNSLKEAAEEDEEYIWGSADADDLGSGAWTQQLARDPKELSIADNSAINSATKILGQTLSTTDEFSFVVASSSVDLSVSQPVETGLNNFFPSAAIPGNAAGGEQAETSGPSSSKEFLGQSAGAHFHDFFQVSPAVARDQSRDPKVQTPDPFSLEGPTRRSVEVKFDYLNQDSLKSTDQLHRQIEQTVIPFPTEEARSYNIETDFDDFFQVVPNSVDRSRGLNGETSVPHVAEESHSHKSHSFDDFFQGISKSVDHSPGLNGEASVSQTTEESNSGTIGTDFDGFFHGVPGSTDHSRGASVETVIPHTEEESNGQDGEADFDDFLQAAPRSAAGSQEETPVPLVAEDFSVQREEPYFDFIFQPSPPSASQARGQNAEAAVPHLPEKSSGQNLESDFDFFFQPGPGSVNESSAQKVDNHFEDLFEVTRKSADKDHGQNTELLFPTLVERNNGQNGLTDFHDLFQALPESNKLATPVPPTAEGSRGQDGEVDLDDFFQGAPVPAGPPPSRKKDEAGPKLADFDNFFQSSSNSAKTLGGHSARTNFDYFFQTPIKSKDRGQGEHAQPTVPDVKEESKSQTMEPDFDNFFQAADSPINHSHGQKITVAVNTAEETVGQNGGIQFEDFLKAAPRSMGHSNGHDKAEHVDFFQVAPPSAKESSGKTVSTGFDGFFAGVPHPADKAHGQSEKIDFDPFSQFSSWSIDKSLGTTDSSDGDFDDFVQAAPQSADKVGTPSQKTEVDPFFQAAPRLVDNSQQRLTGDFDDFFGASPQTAGKAPDMHRRTELEFSKASFQAADNSYKKESTDFGDLFQVPSPRNEVPKQPSSPAGLFVLGNGTGQNTHAGAGPISTLTEGRSSNGETLRQLEARQSPQSPSRGHLEPQSKMPNDLADLSFRLADPIAISDEAATNMWSFI